MRGEQGVSLEPISIQDADGADKRFAPRRQRQIPALLYLDGIVEAVPCLIVDNFDHRCQAAHEGRMGLRFQIRR